MPVEVTGQLAGLRETNRNVATIPNLQPHGRHAAGEMAKESGGEFKR